MGRLRHCKNAGFEGEGGLLLFGLVLSCFGLVLVLFDLVLSCDIVKM